MERNLWSANITCSVLGLLRPKAKLFLDFGGGHGVFVRMMRDLGFDFYWSDAFAENLYARGFEQPANYKFDLITAFEVIEHLPEPLEEISKMMELAEDVLMSTEVLPDPAPQPEEWWYYSLSTGQHISFYSAKTLRVIARKFGRYLVSVRGIHLFSKSPISASAFSFSAHPRLARIMKLFVRRRSLMDADYRKLTRS